MGMSDLPRINEAVAFLNDFAPEERDQLASDPALAALLVPGVSGGPSEPTSRQGLLLRAQVLSKALDAAVRKSKPIIDEASNRIAAARRMRFISLSLAAVGASTVIGTAFVAPIATIVAGVFTLASNISALFSNVVILGGQNREAELAAAIRNLVKDVGVAELARRLLKVSVESEFNVDEMTQMLREGNELFERIVAEISVIEA